MTINIHRNCSHVFPFFFCRIRKKKVFNFNSFKFQDKGKISSIQGFMSIAYFSEYLYNDCYQISAGYRLNFPMKFKKIYSILWCKYTNTYSYRIRWRPYPRVCITFGVFFFSIYFCLKLQWMNVFYPKYFLNHKITRQ